MFASFNRPDLRAGAAEHGDPMRQLLFLSALSLAACSDGDAARKAAEENRLNTSLNEIEARYAPLPKGWRYTTRHDEIRSRDSHLAARVNDDTDPLLANSVTLAVQSDPGEPPTVFFTAVDGNFRCFSSCGLAWRAGERTGIWSGRGLDEERILVDDREAVETLLTARNLTVELPTDRTAQYHFDLTGLRVAR